MAALRSLLLAAALLLPAVSIAQVIGYVVNSDDETEADRLLRVDLETGAGSFVGALPAELEDVEGLAFSSDGTLFAVDSATKTLVRIDPDTAGVQVVDARPGNLGFPLANQMDFGLTFTCDGRLLLVAEQTQSLYEVNTDTGAAQLIGQSGGLGDAMTAIASFGDTTYALAADSRNFYEVDTLNGTASLIGTVASFDITDAGMAFDAAGTLWAVSSDFSFDPSRIFTIDPQTAQIQEQSQSRAGIESLAIVPPSGCGLIGPPGSEPVPADAWWALLLMVIGVGGVALRYRT